MDPKRWCRIDKLFHEALKQDAGKRAPFLRRACNGDGEMRAEVESLLAAHGDGSSVLESPAFAMRMPDDSSCRHPTTRISRRVGAYTLLAVLGRGGSGIVYEAEPTIPAVASR